MPAHRPTTTPRVGSATRRRAAVVGGSLLVVALTGAVSMGSAAAQVDPPPDPTTTAVATTAAPSTTTPTPVVVTTVAPAPTVAPTITTTQRPVVTTVPTTTVSAAAGIQVPTTTTSPPSSTTSSTAASTTTAGLLVESEETVTSEPVAESADELLGSTDKLRLVVAALIAIAVVVAVLTVVYWRRTRPYEWEEWDEGEEEAEAGRPAPDGAVTGMAATVPVARAVRPDHLAESTAVGGAPAARPAMPVVPSLIDPDLRARLGSSSSPTGDQDPATQAMPIVAGADEAGGETGPPAVPDGPTRWGTGRAQGRPVISADPGPDADLDAPFRPPPQPGA